MKKIELKRPIRRVFAPAVCAALLSACASYEQHEVVRQSTSASAPAATAALFDQLDTNRDGFLSRAEVEPLALPAYNPGAPWIMSFEGLDINRDAFLSRSEAAPLMASTRVSSGRWVVVTTAPFERFDSDRDGFLNRAESASLMNAATFDRFDTNRDGFLSKAEAEVFFRANVGGTNSSSGGTVYGPR